MAEVYKFFFGGPGSDAASYIGLLLTVVGFAITIAAVRRAKSTSEEVKLEVLRVRNDIQRIDTVNDLSSAILMLDEIRTLQRECKWSLLPDRYSSLKKLLISIKNSYPDLSSTHKSTLQNTLQHITDIDHKLELAIKSKSEPANIPKINKILSLQQDNVYEMLVELRNSIGVEKNDKPKDLSSSANPLQ